MADGDRAPAGAPIEGLTRPEPPPGSRHVAVRDELDEFFSDQPAVHLYALADLDEPFWSASTWYRRGDAVVGLIGMPGDGGLAAYAVATRDVAGTLDLVADLAPGLPSGLLVTGPVGLAERLTTRRPVSWWGPHVRHEWADPVDLDADRTADPRWVAEPLGPADLDRLRALYAVDPGAVFFLPSMLDDATFVGVRRSDGSALVAAAGTHVVSERHGLAALGAVFTVPERRGLGLGRTATAGAIRRVLQRLDRSGAPTIGLNVAAGNGPARRLYESLGFRAIHTYEEAELA